MHNKTRECENSDAAKDRRWSSYIEWHRHGRRSESLASAEVQAVEKEGTTSEIRPQKWTLPSPNASLMVKRICASGHFALPFPKAAASVQRNVLAVIALVTDAAELLGVLHNNPIRSPKRSFRCCFNALFKSASRTPDCSTVVGRLVRPQCNLKDFLMLFSSLRPHDTAVDTRDPEPWFVPRFRNNAKCNH